jgi:PKD repeat protein
MRTAPLEFTRPGLGLPILLMGALLLASCGDLRDQAPTAPEMESQAAERQPTAEVAALQDFGPAIQAADRFTEALMRIPGVVGTGVGLNEDGRPAVKIFLAHDQVRGIPTALGDVPAAPVVTGPFELRQDRTARARPAPIGFSVGHPDITAGTLGARVTDGSNVYILSNNHVLANSNDADIGDSALQPGSFDGGSDPGDAIGNLYEYYEIVFGSGSANEMDAAIALVDGADVSGSTPETDGYGSPTTNPVDPSVGMGVQKYGRTTGHTTGTVEEINVTVSVCFAGFIFCTQSATFVNQFTITPGDFSDGGDSGSLIVTSGNDPVGLLFAGSSSRTIANPIEVVLDHFGVSIDPTVPGDENGEPDPEPEPEGPTASFTYSCDELSCSFDASGSSAGDEPIESYDWDFGDGNAGSGVTTSHTFASDGTYTVTLTVTDANGESDSEAQSVSVAEDPGDEDPVTNDPVIESFEHTTRTTGPWQRATVQWAVSHPDNALESVTSELLASDGGLLDSQTSSVSGGSASGEHELRTRNGTPAQLRLTVTDTEGNTTIQTKDY